MDPMFPSQGNPPAAMFQDLRGSGKRTINYFWVLVGDLAMDGTSGRYFFEVVGTAGDAPDEPKTSPLSYDVLSAESDDIFSEGEPAPFTEAAEAYIQRYGLLVDPASWVAVPELDGLRGAVSRSPRFW